MLLKPATPLTVLLLAAFTLLLLSTISTPIVKGIPLATFENVDFGVFGYCKGSQCSGVRVGYTTNNIFGADDNNAGDFNLPSSARNSLSAILIVHPVAAFLTLICLIMAAASHLRSPSHSPRYLLALLILLLPTVLVSLLAFLVDILLFVPHLQWGGWIVLAATIILVSCGVVTCAMRRTLVSRKARKRRIAENAEMSGDDFYRRQNAETPPLTKADSPPPLSTETKAPLISDRPSIDSAPAFASFDSSNRGPEELRAISSRTPSNHTPPVAADNGLARYGPPGRGDITVYNGPRDEYGNTPPPAGPYGGDPRMMRAPSDPRLQNQYSDGSLGSRRGPSPGYGPSRGRGAYPLRGGLPRGGPNGGRPRGPPSSGRGGAMGAMRGGPPGMVTRGRGPPPGYPPRRDGPPGGYDQYGAIPRRPSQPSGDGPETGDHSYRGPMPGGPMRGPPPGRPEIAEMDGAGQAYEMTAQPSASHLPMPDSGDYIQPLRDSHQESVQSPTSVYSGAESYQPPRAGWADNGRRGSPAHERSMTHSPRHARSGSGDHYYEDVEPRFAEPTEPAVGDNRVPSALIPGGSAGETPPLTVPSETVPEAPRSPAPSDLSHVSHFTSISERPINPRWQGPPGPAPSRIPQNQDMLLGGNPDFELPASRGRGGRYGRGGRMTPVPESRTGGRYPTPTPQ